MGYGHKLRDSCRRMEFRLGTFLIRLISRIVDTYPGEIGFSSLLSTPERNEIPETVSVKQ